VHSVLRYHCVQRSLCSFCIHGECRAHGEGGEKKLLVSGLDGAGRREYLEVVLESAPDAIVTLDADHRILDWNSGAAELFGYTRDEVVGHDVDELISRDDTVREARSYTEKVLRGERIPPVETVRYRRDGTPVDVLLSGAPIIVDGVLLGVIGVYTDITQRKLYEAELMRSRRLESLGTLAGGIAHDFNNLLSGIFGNISIVSSLLPEDSPARGYLDAVEGSMSRAVALTHQLLTFARGSEPVVRSLDTGGLLRETVAFHLAGCSVKAEFDLPGDLWCLRGDARQLGEVISNLVINARESMPEGGKLEVAARNLVAEEAAAEGLKEGRFVRMDFRDSGTGIPAEDLDRIFEPFFSTRPQGTGLGLAVVHSVVEKHGGRTRVFSVPGEGSTFSIFLPVSDSLPNKAETAGAIEEQARPGGIRVLVMDDEDYVRNVAAGMLEALGQIADLASNGQEAVSMYARAMSSGSRYDVVILDLTVAGGMGGRDAAGKILAMDENAVLVVSSGYSTDPVMADHLSCGFSGVLSKPYTMKEMDTLLRALTGTGERDAAP